jgi:hypothetical protein
MQAVSKTRPYDMRSPFSNKRQRKHNSKQGAREISSTFKRTEVGITVALIIRAMVKTTQTLILSRGITRRVHSHPIHATAEPELVVCIHIPSTLLQNEPELALCLVCLFDTIQETIMDESNEAPDLDLIQPLIDAEP